MTSDEFQKVKRLMSQGPFEPHHPKAFVSHSTQGHAFVERFATDLRTNAVDAWFSKWEIQPGDSIRAKIDEGLEACEYFIIVLSQDSVGRPWVRSELDAATVRKLVGKVRKIIPVKIEDCGDLPPTLASLCWEDFSSQPYEVALQRVVDSIFDVDVRPPLGQIPARQGPGIAELITPALSEQQERRTSTQFPISAFAADAFTKQLRSEGFDARTDLYNGQVGVIVGPRGLDRRRMRPNTAGFFFPLWELNYETNRPLVEARKFLEIYQGRPKDWLYNRPYQRELGITMKSTLTIHEDAWLRDGPVFAGGQATGYRVGGLPAGEEARIANFGAPNRSDWRIMRIRGATQSEWTGNYESAEIALAVIQSDSE